MKNSRQSEHLQEKTLSRLAALIPHDCPLAVRRHPSGSGFQVVSALGSPGVDARVFLAGRYQVVAAFIDGYVRRWQERACADTDHENP